jgi:hypothetical protein
MPGSVRIEKLLSRRVSRILIVVLSLLVIALSLTPRPEQVLGRLSAYDKLGHFAAYVALVVAGCAALRGKKDGIGGFPCRSRGVGGRGCPGRSPDVERPKWRRRQTSALYRGNRLNISTEVKRMLTNVAIIGAYRLRLYTRLLFGT